MQEIKSLIDKASKVCGGDIELAKRMGTHAQSLSNMRHGKRTITPETAMELADIAGENVYDAAMTAILTRSEKTRRGEVLKAIVGKLQRATVGGVAAMLLFSYMPEVKAVAMATARGSRKVDSLYIVEYGLRCFQATLRTICAVLSKANSAKHKSMTRQTMFSRNFAG